MHLNILLLHTLYVTSHIVSCSAFYEKEAMLMDPVDGPILASLLGIYKQSNPLFCLTVLTLSLSDQLFRTLKKIF